MAGGLIAAVLTPHTPRMGIEERAPPFVKGLIEGERELGRALRAMKPDLFVLQTAHWVSTFHWFVTAHAVHKGICFSDEAPDLIPGEPYERKGDPEFAKALAESLNAASIPCGINDSPHYDWDYGTYVPLKYMDPEAAIPVVTLPTVLCADLKENLAVGPVVHETAVRLGRRVIFVSSCALSHKLIRGPELWPREEQQVLDRKILELFSAGRVKELVEFMPVFSKAAYAEMGGRTLCGMIGAAQALERVNGAVHGQRFGAYAQSSGTGNAAVCITAGKAA
jgi:3,4-dihydroxyphenylacetate 2,3-dioxygenase